MTCGSHRRCIYVEGKAKVSLLLLGYGSNLVWGKEKRRISVGIIPFSLAGMSYGLSGDTCWNWGTVIC